LLNRDIWHDEESFFMHEIIQFKNHYYAYGYAVNLLKKKEYQKAERFFRIAIKHDPNQAKDYINYAALLIDTGRPDAALLQLNKVESLAMIQSQSREWFNNVGMAYFKLNKYDNVLEHFRKAVHFSPKEPQFWANLGAAYGSAIMRMHFSPYTKVFKLIRNIFR
jgi:tetratricopeptide (TPR) repeat protein